MAALSLSLLLGSPLFFAGPAIAGEAVTVEVCAGRHPRQGTPVFLELSPELQSWKGFQLTEAATGRSVPVQLEPGARPRLAWMLEQRLAAGDARRYRLESRPVPAEETAAVDVRREDGRVQVDVAGKPAIEYHTALVPSDRADEPYFGRSGFIHPVFDPAGQSVTDSMPPDHKHQHGIWFAWANTRFEGRAVNFWDSKLQQGAVRHVELAATAGGPVFGSFTARLDHVDLTAPGGPKVALQETWRVQVYRAGGGSLFDISSTQTCAGPSPITLNKFTYGGMAIRGARPWFGRGNCEFLTSEGKTRADGNHTRARWCEMYGQLQGRASGIAVFGHPANFRAPQPVRLHPDKPFFCWAPMVLGPFAIKPGDRYQSRYRYYVHQGKPEPAVDEQLWNDFADPPQARMVGQ
jgi:hypothetical protein